MSEHSGSEAIRRAIESCDGPAICAYVTAGYPTLDSFRDILDGVARAADVVEIGVPFTDPMADGLTIQESNRAALDQGVTLEWIFDLLASINLAAPHLLMGYYNPFLAYGFGRLVDSMVAAGTVGLIVPDLPLEEEGELRGALEPDGLALVHLVTPSTSSARLNLIASSGSGFTYAVTTAGVTGGTAELPSEALDYLDRVRVASPFPVLAGFGVRSQEQVSALAGHVDGVVVGSALIDAIGQGDDPGRFVESLRLDN